MANPQVNYLYTDGNLLEQPNTYFYSCFQGKGFINAWQKNRLESINIGVESYRPSDVISCGTERGEIDTKKQLLNLINDKQSDEGYWLSFWIKKFEVAKRIYNCYQHEPPHRAVKSSGFHDINSYLLFAEYLSKTEEKESKLQVINTLLKVMDTLVSRKKIMTEKQCSNLNWLLKMEKEIINKLQKSYK
mgnify:CR=1 FL=1